MNEPYPNETRVRVKDTGNFYDGREGEIADSFDGRELGGRISYTVRLDRQDGAQVSFATRAENLEVLAMPWGSLAGLRGSADRCTCSDEQLSLVGCDCDAQQNLPVRCKQPGCDNFLREQIEIDGETCRSCFNAMADPPEPAEPDLWLGPEFADEIGLEERWAHYAFEERNGMPYGSSF